MAMYYGFDIGGSKIKAGRFDKSAAIAVGKRAATPKESYADFLRR